jgi:hypothetical protein
VAETYISRTAGAAGRALQAVGSTAEAYAVQDAMLAEATGLGLGPLWGCAPRATCSLLSCGVNLG